ncbi:TIGR01213 family protein [Edhazardia aedis USNM 41457]|uniref:tRNA pseudouridine(55) synthase n=1 Tax=Edhazardia aedis (strain USNM 41457) TaxID=1003232 RepID=J9DQQ9_EDHAE|nr:TIGR01213 family protein [Edhazardia aedis USNM 41457]|eukprot:EJW04900.1 TIGR01213 family protein [Edhazardia aedis USNM 41457]
MNQISSLIKKEIKTELDKSLPKEYYDTFVYSVRDETKCLPLKLLVKSLFRSATTSENYTEVEIILKANDNADSLEKLNDLFFSSNKIEKIENEILKHISIEVKTRNTPIFVYGKYIKLNREMSQTPMLIGGKLVTEKSVSDFKKYFGLHFDATSVVFVTGGREDINVRCFGRPFLLKILEPKQNLNIFQIPLKLYSSIKINDLYVVKDIRDQIFGDENLSRKKYGATVFCKGDWIVNSGAYELEQRTPLRVLHRRANLNRKRKIEIVETIKKDIETYYVELYTDAGTYVKEFVNGDFGRTVPSLTSINRYFCDCIELDVLEICKDPLDEEFIISKITIIND